MNYKKPFVLSFAGHDPSAGAGLTADIKTFENHDVYGLTVCTAITFQNENNFTGVQWLSMDNIHKQYALLIDKYEISAVKIGLVKNSEMLLAIIDLTSQLNIPIIWDPILSASAGFKFHENFSSDDLKHICNNLAIITPNIPEANTLFELSKSDDTLKDYSWLCPILLKGGHGKEDFADKLYYKGVYEVIKGSEAYLFPKHGTGCILSSSIASHLAKGQKIKEACIRAKAYIEKYMATSNQLLGYHHNINKE